VSSIADLTWTKSGSGPETYSPVEELKVRRPNFVWLAMMSADALLQELTIGSTAAAKVEPSAAFF